MSHIEPIEEPFHKPVHGGAFAALPVIEPQNRQRERNAHLQNAVHAVDGKEIYDRIERDIEKKPEALLFELAAVRAERHDAERGNAAPVARKAHKADKQNEQHPHCAGRDLFAFRDAQHHKTPRKRPHNARLVERAAVVERDKGAPVDEIVREIYVAEMRDQRENKETCGILADVPRVVIPLGDAVAHDRAGDAPDEMHEQGEKFLRIPRKHRPRDVIDGHRGDGNELYGVGAERVFLCEGHSSSSCR